MSGADRGWSGSDDSYRSTYDKSNDDSWSAYDRSSSSGTSRTSYTPDTGSTSSYRTSSYHTSTYTPDPPRSSYYAPSPTVAPRAMTHAYAPRFDTDAKPLSSSKKNAIIVALDMTGSMSSWLPELFKFLPLLHQEASKLLNGDTEILFVTFGDYITDDEVNTVQFGSGPELDQYLTALNVTKGGGGNSCESPEIALDYVDRYVDLSASQNVYTFIVTDEGVPSVVSREGFRTSCPKLSPGESRTTKQLISDYRIKSDLAVIFGSIGYGEYTQKDMKASWAAVLGQTPLLPLERANLIVEVMLAYIAKKNGKMDAFTKAYDDRRGDTTYGDVNLKTVMKTVALVPDGAIATPTVTKGTKSLIPTGTKSLDSAAATPSPATVVAPKIDLVIDRGGVTPAPKTATVAASGKGTKSLM